jgi:hypothetical protein
MANWYEVYESDAVLREVRQRVTRLLVFGTPGALLASLLAAIFLTQTPPAWIPASAVMGLAVGGGIAFLRLWHGTRQAVWCVKLSDRAVEGYNYARVRTRIDWTKVSRVSLTERSILVESHPGPSIEILDLFPDFSALGHRVVEYAEFFGIPVCVDGKPWEEMDLNSVYPFLARDKAV